MAEALRILPSLPHGDTQKHGKRYTAQDHETAYVQWRACRSLRAVAKETDINVSTLHEWSKAEEWKVRADREDAEDIAGARTAITGQAMPALHRGIARLVKIVDDDGSDDRDAIKATELLGRFTGTLAPANAGQPFTETPATGQLTVTAAQLRALSPDDLTEYAETGVLPSETEARPPA